MNIYLIGFMGSGKSTVGQILSKRLDRPLFDMDAAIERGSGLTINEIFVQKGEDEFRVLEKEILDETFKENDLIVATGGGTPCFHENMMRMNTRGITIFLNASSTVLKTRIEQGDATRPLLKETVLKETIDTLLAKRFSYYKLAEHIVNTDNRTPDQIADLITSLVASQ